jgi:hypothetical protein
MTAKEPDRDGTHQDRPQPPYALYFNLRLDLLYLASYGYADAFLVDDTPWYRLTPATYAWVELAGWLRKNREEFDDFARHVGPLRAYAGEFFDAERIPQTVETIPLELPEVTKSYRDFIQEWNDRGDTWQSLHNPNSRNSRNDHGETGTMTRKSRRSTPSRQTGETLF